MPSEMMLFIVVALSVLGVLCDCFLVMDLLFLLWRLDFNYIVVIIVRVNLRA